MIRTASEPDARAIARIHWDSWVSTYTGVFPQASFDEFPLERREALWSDMARAARDDPAARRRLLIADAGGDVQGFACVGPWRANGGMPEENDVGELWALYVRPDRMRCGVGAALWGGATAWLREKGFREMRLWVIAGNAAVAFYLRQGASKLGSSTFNAHGVEIDEHCYRIALNAPQARTFACS